MGIATTSDHRILCCQPIACVCSTRYRYNRAVRPLARPCNHARTAQMSIEVPPMDSLAASCQFKEGKAAEVRSLSVIRLWLDGQNASKRPCDLQANAMVLLHQPGPEELQTPLVGD